MDIYRLALLVVLLTLIGFITVFHQVKIWRSGYRINELREQKRLLSEERRRLELDVARAQSSQVLLARAAALAVPVSLPAQYNVVRVADPDPAPTGTVEREPENPGNQ